MEYILIRLSAGETTAGTGTTHTVAYGFGYGENSFEVVAPGDTVEWTGVVGHTITWNPPPRDATRSLRTEKYHETRWARR